MLRLGGLNPRRPNPAFRFRFDAAESGALAEFGYFDAEFGSRPQGLTNVFRPRRHELSPNWRGPPQRLAKV